MAVVRKISVFKKMEIGKNYVTLPKARNWHQNKSVFKTILAFLLMSACDPNIFAETGIKTIIA
jgi:hypothetical protein